jgi:hypothetical protein
MQITALVAATLFMENLDSNVIVTALPQMARSSAVPVQSAFEHRDNGLHAHFSCRHPDQQLDGGWLPRTARVHGRDSVSLWRASIRRENSQSQQHELRDPPRLGPLRA